MKKYTAEMTISWSDYYGFRNFMEVCLGESWQTSETDSLTESVSLVETYRGRSVNYKVEIITADQTRSQKLRNDIRTYFIDPLERGWSEHDRQKHSEAKADLQRLMLMS